MMTRTCNSRLVCLLLLLSCRQSAAWGFESGLAAAGRRSCIITGNRGGAHTEDRTVRTNCPTATTRLGMSTERGEEYGRTDREILRSLQEDQIQRSLIEALFQGEGDDNGDNDDIVKLADVQLVGQTKLPLRPPSRSAKKNRATIPTRPVLVLTSPESAKAASAEATPSILLPLVDQAQLQIVSFAVARRPLSKSVMLQLNLQFINRDGALFDNLPWSAWSVDPQMRNRDAAGNSILAKFHLGKRDAYNRFVGKDWQGRSLAIGNLALRLKYMMEPDNDAESLLDGLEETPDAAQDPASNRLVLAKRILELRIRELRMDLAGVESEIALQSSPGSDEAQQPDSLRKQKDGLLQELAETEEDLRSMNEQATTQTPPSVVSQMLEKIASWSTDDGKNAAPYRGATGYAPMLDTADDVDGSLMPYTNPYDLLVEILEDQLNAKVIGCVLENTSLLRGNVALGGAVVLQRIVAKQTIKVMGETLQVDDPDEEYGNQGIKGGEVMLVECDADEAVSVSAALQIPLQVEASIMDRSSSLCRPSIDAAERAAAAASSDPVHILNTLPSWTVVDPISSLQVEGSKPPNDDSNSDDNDNESGDDMKIEARGQNVSPIAIPRTTTGIADIVSADTSPNAAPLFPSDNPIKTVDEFDALSNADKAKTLLEMSNFQGRLPRPRTVRTASPNPLDTLLLPLVDESVRRSIQIRQAKEQGDVELAARLEEEKSRYQKAKDAASNAREMGTDEAADGWETEAEFLGGLRADVTQDEGAYSRFLDKDDWYERDRQANARRAKKSSFGSLLDGIE